MQNQVKLDRFDSKRNPGGENQHGRNGSCEPLKNNSAEIVTDLKCLEAPTSLWDNPRYPTNRKRSSIDEKL